MTASWRSTCTYRAARTAALDNMKERKELLSQNKTTTRRGFVATEFIYLLFISYYFINVFV